MRKVSPRLVAIMMASVVSVTSIAPVTAYNHVTVNAAQLQQQAIDWTFTGNGKVDNDKIQLSGAGDNIGITNIKKEDNYAVKAKLAQGEEDGAVGVMMGAKEAKEQVQDLETDELIDKIYDGSVDKLFAALLGRKKLSMEQINNLKQIVSELE